MREEHSEGTPNVRAVFKQWHGVQREAVRGAAAGRAGAAVRAGRASTRRPQQLADLQTGRGAPLRPPSCRRPGSSPVRQLAAGLGARRLIAVEQLSLVAQHEACAVQLSGTIVSSATGSSPPSTSRRQRGDVHQVRAVCDRAAGSSSSPGRAPWRDLRANVGARCSRVAWRPTVLAPCPSPERAPRPRCEMTHFICPRS